MDPTTYEPYKYKNLFKAYLLASTILIVVIMFNILIAFLSDIYATVRDKAK